MTPLLDCNIWSITNCNIDQFFLVEKIYHFNSITDDIIDIVPGFIQVPEFEIKNLHLLNHVNYDIINVHFIPIVQMVKDGVYEINLKYYDQINNHMQSNNS